MDSGFSPLSIRQFSQAIFREKLCFMSQLSHEQMSKLLGNRSNQQIEIPNISPDETANLLAISGMWKAALGIQPADPAWEKVACGSGVFPSHQFLQQASLRAAIAIQQTYGITVLANEKTAGASRSHATLQTRQ
jgi:hypothetical protein